MKEWPGFARWQSLSARIWDESEASAGGAGAVYIDLFHHFPDYLIYSLSIGRLIARITGLPAIGLTGSIGVVETSCPDYDVDDVEAIARGFGVPVVQLADTPDVEAAITRLAVSPAIQRAPQRNDDRHLRQRIRDLSQPDGFPLGRYAHDTYLRRTLRESVREFDVDLFATYARCLSLDEGLSRLWGACRPAWLVSGHIDYAPWGILVHRALEAGARVAHFRTEGNARIHILHSPPARSETLNGRLRSESSGATNAVIDTLSQAGEAAVEAHFVEVARGARFKSYRFVPWPMIDCQSIGPRLSLLAKRLLGVKTDRPCIAAFSITFSNIPLHDEQVFDDNFQWLRETLIFAATRPELEWIVKVHPYDEVYNRTGAMAALEAEFGAVENIHFIAADIPLALVLAGAEVVTSLRGSPGMQAAACGRHSVFAGRGQYSDHGFAHVAETAAEYFRMLEECASAPSVPRGRTLRARAFMVTENIVFANPSSMIGQFGELGALGPGAFERLALRAEWYVPEKDPLYAALSKALATGASRVGGDFVPTSAGGAALARASIARSSDDGAAREFVVGPVWPAGFVPLHGFHGVEDWGVWTNGEELVFLLGVPAPIEGALVLDMDLFSAIAPEWPRPTIAKIVIDDVDVTGTIEERAKGYRVETKPGRFGTDGYVVVQIETDGGVVPADMGTSGDTRRLVFSLTRIVMKVV